MIKTETDSSTALEMHVAVAVLRVQEGLDYTGIIADFEWTDNSANRPEGSGQDNPCFTREDSSSSLPVRPAYSAIKEEK